MSYQPVDVLLDTYRIEELIDEGSFGEVYRVTHLVDRSHCGKRMAAWYDLLIYYVLYIFSNYFSKLLSGVARSVKPTLSST